ncbi:hypothetical protein FACS1894199_15590 [Bacteroidia bacterium]|nr:hypothetical protein FACS1894199_15590 [Bacteroidia bacterium]
MNNLSTEMRITLKIAFFLLTLFIAATAQAQLNPTMYHMKDLPVNNQLNPAFQPLNGSIYIGFPALSSLSFNAMLMGEGVSVGNIMDQKFKAMVTGKGDFAGGGFGLDYSPLNFGFMVKDMYFTFDAKMKVNIEGRVPKDLQELIWFGNGNAGTQSGHIKTLGKELELAGLGVDATAYAEIALGFSKSLLANKQLILGGKIKYLQGIANVSFGLDEGSFIKTDENTYEISALLKPKISAGGALSLGMKDKASVPFDSIMNSLTDAMNNIGISTGSRGVGFDLGGSWYLPWVGNGRKLNVSASVLNLGFINWQGTTVEASENNKPLTFDGISMDGGSDFATGLMDSIQVNTKVTLKTAGERVWLSPTLYVGANYELFKYLNVGALFGYQFSKSGGTPLYSVSLNTQKFMVNASLSYSYYNGNNNVGLGLLLGKKYFQYHLIADNLLAAVDFKNAQNVNIRLGLGLLFGKSEEKRRGKDGEKERKGWGWNNGGETDLREVEAATAPAKTPAAEEEIPAVIEEVAVEEVVAEVVEDAVVELPEEPSDIETIDEATELPGEEVLVVDERIRLGEEPHFYIIAGSYKNRGYASNAMQKFVRDGFSDARLLLDNDNGLYRVCVMSLYTIEEARQRVAALKRSSHLYKDFWILKK